MKSIILYKYLVKEALLYFLAVFIVLLLIMLGGGVVKLLAKVADGSLDANALFPLLFWGSVRSMSILFTVSMFIAILMSIGRLYKDSEIYALRAVGIGDTALLAPYMVIGVIGGVMLSILAFYIAPLAEKNTYLLRQVVAKNVDLAGITPGRFISLPGHGRVIFAEGLDQDNHQLKNVYLFERNGSQQRIMTADSARQVNLPALGGRFLEFSGGELFQSGLASDGYSLSQYEKGGIRLPELNTTTETNDIDMLTTHILLKSSNPKHIAEFHWRLSSPVSLLVLILLAIPLSYSTPRQGQFSKLAIAAILYIFYSNLLGLGKNWIETEKMPGFLGLWWVHLLFVLLALSLVISQRGAWRRLFKIRQRTET